MHCPRVQDFEAYLPQAQSPRIGDERIFRRPARSMRYFALLTAEAQLSFAGGR